MATVAAGGRVGPTDHVRAGLGRVGCPTILIGITICNAVSESFAKTQYIMFMTNGQHLALINIILKSDLARSKSLTIGKYKSFGVGLKDW